MSSNPLRRNVITTPSRDIDGINRLRAVAMNNLIAVPSTVISSPAIRDLLASDISAFNPTQSPSSSFTFQTAAMQATASAAGNVSLTFALPQGKAIVIYGYADLTAGTKYVDALQFTINGNSIPLQPIPLSDVLQGPEPAVYFSPVKAVVANQTVVVTIHFTGAGTETFQLKGYIAESSLSS